VSKDSARRALSIYDIYYHFVHVSQKIDAEGLYFPSEMGGGLKFFRLKTNTLFLEHYNHDLIVRQYKSITLAQ